MTKEETIGLIQKYEDGLCTADEQRLLEQWYITKASESSDIVSPADLWIRKEASRDFIHSHIAGQRLKIKPKFYRLLPRIAVAASLIIAVSVGIFLRNKSLVSNNKRENITYKNDISPGKNAATLILSNGKKILLSDAIKGELAKESGVSIYKTADGQIVYQAKENNDDAGNGLNTLKTARGEQYTVLLPDGSKVWLNAASSLIYPANFAALKERRVKLSGEAYFEIAKDRLHPFIVSSEHQQVKVLGTHFNINAYPEELATKTTLLEGSVKVNQDVTLKPGEQSTLTSAGIKVIPVLAETYVDWKDGAFNFKKENLKSIMRKVSRWYDVEIIYNGTEDDRQTFTGYVSRSENVSKVLDVLSEISNLKFNVEGRKIIVSQ